jgi:hypothetical protein
MLDVSPLSGSRCCCSAPKQATSRRIVCSRVTALKRCRSAISTVLTSAPSSLQPAQPDVVVPSYQPSSSSSSSPSSHPGKLDFSYYSSVMGDATAIHSSSNSNSNSSGNNSSSNSGTSLPPSPSPELLKLTSFASLLFAAAATVLGI